VVDRLCAEAERRSVRILRDKATLRVGDNIPAFMQRMARGGRIFVVLSDKYLRSPFCMYELFKAWDASKAEGETFLRRVRVYCLPDAQIGTPLQRARYAKAWKEQHDELAAFIREHGADLLGEEDFRQFKLMQDFYGRVSDILATMAAIVRPDSFEQLTEYGFEGLPEGIAPAVT
jgi:internalin A